MNDQFAELTKSPSRPVTRHVAMRHFRLGLATVAIVQAIAISLGAATLTVSNINDNGSGSLRQAIQTAAPGDTINCAVAGTITLTAGQLLIAKNLTIAGPGAVTLAVSGNMSSRVFEIRSNALVNISGLTIRNGHAPDGVAAGARGTNGGGIYNAGTLALTGCAISGNSAGSASTAFSTSIGVGGAGGSGGGIYNAGNLSLTACTVSGNIAGTGGRGAAGGVGGMGGGVYNIGTLVLLNSTLSSNVAGAGGFNSAVLQGVTGGSGGGLYNAGTLTVAACTLGGNRAGQGGPPRIGGKGGTGGSGGGIFNATNAVFAKVRSSLIALNAVGPGGPRTTDFTQAGANGTGWDLFGPFTSQGHNLIGAPYPSTGFTNGINADLVGPLDPKLGPLQDNGGPTLTMALLPGSLALNAGDDALPGPPFNLTTDQRGLPRKSGTHVDIGAFEFQAVGLLKQAPSQVLLSPQFSNRSFRFTVLTQPGTLGRIEASEDLQTWTTLANFTSAAGGSYEFIDSSALDFPQRFYRVVNP